MDVRVVVFFNVSLLYSTLCDFILFATSQRSLFFGYFSFSELHSRLIDWNFILFATSQRPEEGQTVHWTALQECLLNGLVFVIVFVIGFLVVVVFLKVFWLVRSCLDITLGD